MNTNSTNHTDSLITGLFHDLLNAHVVNGRELGTRYDPVADTYFSPPLNGDCTYFFECSFDTKMELKEHLTATVENMLKGIPAELFERWAELAFLLKDRNTEQAPDLSPFVYTLY